MKFGETFNEYLKGEQEKFLLQCSHVDYKRLKKVLKKCKVCHAAGEAAGADGGRFSNLKLADDTCQCKSCECYLRSMQSCFKSNKPVSVQEGMMLTDYITANAIAIRKLLKKYDKIHGSVNGKNFNMKMRAEHIELLHSPWLIELGAFYLNFPVSEIGESGEFFKQFSCDLSSSQPTITLVLSDDVKLEYGLTCAVCLDTVFHPYALGCGHLFCKACAVQSASLQVFDPMKMASRRSKCPLCREAGVYRNAVSMLELDLLLKTKCHGYWDERKSAENVEMNKQLRQYYDSQKLAFFYGATW